MLSSDTAIRQHPVGLPPWVMTFADLMTLLMCFFVLMLSFSEMDVARFKLLSGSMKDAFGVQTIVDARTIPKGTSIIAQEFSPGIPDPTAMKAVNQFTVDSSRNTLDALARQARLLRETTDQVQRIRAALHDEIEKGSVAVQTEGLRIIIHILENPSFDSGYADVRPEFLPVLAKIGRLIDHSSGIVTVSGHTDNVPIANERFRSNWELSTSRAVSVAHQLLRTSSLDESRFVVTGHADTRLLAPNDSEANRAKNRRVDISIVRGNELDTVRQINIDDSLASSAHLEDSDHD